MSSKIHALMNSGRLRALLQTSFLALACAAAAGPAHARTAFDGDWSVVIMTQAGSCDPSFRYGVQISDGMVINSGGSPANVQGRVSPSGAVRVDVQAGGQWASGSGRLGASQGTGVWRGQGSAGACSGTWVATRRGNGPYAEQPGQPVYNYAPGVIPQRPQSTRALVAACAARFGSYYDPASGTYLASDGARYRCP
jgi:hypothetical protein